ncbi:MAG: IS66 family insertion sequence element accessory protein TnpA [Chthoniobacterales bacterium]
MRTPREKREKILDEYEKSGMSGVAFAAMVGVKYPTMASWIQQRRKRGKETEAAPGAVSWVEIAGGPEPEAGAMRVQIGTGVWLEVTNGEQAAWAGEMLRAMGVARC